MDNRTDGSIGMKTMYAALGRQGRGLGGHPTRRGPPCPDCATVMEPSHAQPPVTRTACRLEAPAATWECPVCGVQTPREQG